MNCFENLKPLDYHQKVHEDLKRTKGFYEFILECTYSVLRSGRFQGSKLLEIGSGACVHNVASASAYYSTIILSDSEEDNRKELKKWLRRHKNSLDWTQLLDLVIDIEGLSNTLQTSRRLLECRIRDSVQQVIPCDILADLLIPENELKDFKIAPPYDLIMSVCYMQKVAGDLRTYVDILKKVNKLLRREGGIVIAGFEGNKSRRTEEMDSHYLSLSQKDISTALSMAGFRKHEFQVHEKQDKYFKKECGNLFCVVAEKA